MFEGGLYDNLKGDLRHSWKYIDHVYVREVIFLHTN